MPENPHFLEKDIHGESNTGILATGFDVRITGLANDYGTGNSQNLHVIERIIHEHEKKLTQSNLENLIKGSATAGSRTYSVSDFFNKSLNPFSVFFPGASVAYSLRDLKTHEGSTKVATVRRTIGGEQDFTANQITNGELTSFCSEDGFLFSSSSGAFGFTFPQGDESGTYVETSTDTTYTKDQYWKFTKEFAGTWVLNYDDGTNLYRIDSGDSSTVHPKDVDWTSGTVTSTPADFHGSSYGNTYNFLTDTNYYSFTTGSDGFVSIWYDQSGNGNDAAQTQTAKQPKIVNSGSLVVDSNNNPTLEFDGADLLTFTNIVMDADAFSVFSFCDSNVSSSQNQIVGNSSSTRRIAVRSDSGSEKAAVQLATRGNWFPNAGDIQNDDKVSIHTFLKDATEMNWYVDGTNHATDSSASTATDTTFNAIGKTRDGVISEVIIYKDIDKSSERTLIEENINNNYESI